MSSSEFTTAVADESSFRWRLGEVARLGLREFQVMNPPAVLAGAVLPRFLVQVLFFTLLGQAIDGPQQKEYAFVGGLVSALALTNVLYVSQVPVADKDFGTFWRLRIGCLHPMVVFAARSLPYPVMGFVFFLISATVVGPLTGLTELALRLLGVVEIYLLISGTATAAGLAAAALSVGRRADALASNLMGYVIMLCSGAFLPAGRVPFLDTIGALLPARHGLAAIHAQLDGRPWLHLVAAEAAVGVLWSGLACLIVTIQIRRAHRNGHDDFD